MLGSKLLTKMWETTAERGIGGLFKPWQMRREGVATIELRRKEMLVLAQTEKDIEKIKKGEAIVALDDISNPKLISMKETNKENIVDKIEPNLDITFLMQNTRNHLITQEIQKEINVTKSLLVAEQELLNDYSEPPEEDIENDWLDRWRDNAANTSSEQLQELWGRVLAGEVKSPGRYSLRTLDFIKNLTQREALKLERLFSFSFMNGIIRNEKCEFEGEYLNKELNYNFLSEMQSLGIISGVDTLGATITFSTTNREYYERYYIYNKNKKVLCVTSENINKQLTLWSLPLTPLGIELQSLCSSEIDCKYIEFIVNIIKKQGFNVTIGDFKIDNNGNYMSVNQVKI